MTKSPNLSESEGEKKNTPLEGRFLFKAKHSPSLGGWSHTTLNILQQNLSFRCLGQFLLFDSLTDFWLNRTGGRSEDKTQEVNSLGHQERRQRQREKHYEMEGEFGRI